MWLGHMLSQVSDAQYVVIIEASLVIVGYLRCYMSHQLTSVVHHREWHYPKYSLQLLCMLHIPELCEILTVVTPTRIVTTKPFHSNTHHMMLVKLIIIVAILVQHIFLHVLYRYCVCNTIIALCYNVQCNLDYPDTLTKGFVML